MSMSIKPRMTKSELGLIDQCLDSPSMTVLEWGCGGSTKYFLDNKNVSHVVSIESDEEWIDLVEQNLPEESRNRWDPFYKSIGKIGKWSYPVDKTPRKEFVEYQDHPYSGYASNEFNLVLVDGRFRVGCAVRFAYNLALENKNGVEFPRILVHDYPNRAGYKVLESIFELENVIDKLACFSAVKVSTEELDTLFTKYRYDWR